MSTPTAPIETSRRRRLTVLLPALALLVAACGGVAEETDAAAPSADIVFDSGSDTAPDRDAPGLPTETTDGSAPESAAVTPAADDDPASAGESAGGTSEPVKPVDGGDTGAKEVVALDDSVLSRAIRGDDGAAVAPSSMRFDGRISIVTVEGADVPSMELAFGGAIDTQVPASHLTMDMSDMFEAMLADPEMAGMGEDEAFMAIFAEMFAEPLEFIQIGDRAWVSGSMMAFLSPDAVGKWIETEAGEIGADDVNLGMDFVDPDELLARFADGQGTITEVGSETLRGTTTTRYRVVVDAQALAAGMTAEERAEFEGDFGSLDGLAELPFDIWIGDDGLTRKFSIAIGAEVMGPGPDAEDIESVSMVFEMWDYGADVGIAPPPADLIISEDELGAGLFGE